MAKAPAKPSTAPSITRRRAEFLITSGEQAPEKFVDHPNYHVRRKAWEKMGRPLPESAADRTKLLESLKVPRQGRTLSWSPDL